MYRLQIYVIKICYLAYVDCKIEELILKMYIFSAKLCLLYLVLRRIFSNVFIAKYNPVYNIV